MARPAQMSIERLERALRTAARIVAQPGGDRYVPVFEMLEAEVARRRGSQDAKRRALAVLGDDARA